MFKLRLSKIKTDRPRSTPRRRARAPRRRARVPLDAPPPEVVRRPRPTRLPQAGAAPQDASVCPTPRAALYAHRARGGPLVRPRSGRTRADRGAP
jgi:hypothetical protein